MKKANQYIQIVEQLSKTHTEINGDIIYDALLKQNIQPQQIYKISGPLIRISEKLGLIRKTNRCTTSKRNRSSLLRVWETIGNK